MPEAPDREPVRLPTRHFAAAALLLLPLAGCALPGGAPARPGGCRAAAVPEALPPAGALVDTAALDAGIADLRDDTPVGLGHVVFSLAYAADGSNVRRAVVEHTLNPGAADSLQKLVFAHRRVLPAREAEWGVRLRIDLDGAPRYGVERRQLCPPRVRTIGFEDGSIQNPSAPAGMGYQRVWVRVRLDETGQVTDARVERGAVRTGTQEMRLLQYVRTLSFEPAREDGLPVPGEISVPVRTRW